MSRARGRPVKQTTALVPAGARTDALGAIETILNADAIEAFAKAVGGRDVLAETLAVAGVGHEVERMTTLLLDPRYASWSLARLCGLVGISVADLFMAYRKAGIVKAHVEASRIIAKKLVPIVDDVMTRAAPQKRLCSACLGASIGGPDPCLPCDSTGYVQSEPDLDRQKLALELGQLLEKKGGLIVQQNNLAQTVTATGAGSLEQLQQAVGDLLFGERRPGERPDVIVPAPQPNGDPGDDDDPNHDADDAHDDEDDEDDATPPRGLPETPVQPLAPPQTDPPSQP